MSEIERLRAALQKIADMQGENDEWDAVDRYHECQSIAVAALAATELREESKHE